MVVRDIMNLAGPPTVALLSLILPAVTIIGHGSYIWLKFLR